MHICDKCIEQAHGIVLRIKISGSSISWRFDFEKTKRKKSERS
jgi:hypothetical protein